MALKSSLLKTCLGDTLFTRWRKGSAMRPNRLFHIFFDASLVVIGYLGVQYWLYDANEVWRSLPGLALGVVVGSALVEYVRTRRKK